MPLTTQQAADRHDVIPRRIQALAKQGRIPGATKHGRDWIFPDDFIIIAPPERPAAKATKIKR